MVARNFSLQDYPYTRLLEIADEEREFLNLEELKPHQLQDLAIASPLQQTLKCSLSAKISNESEHQTQATYFDLNAQQATNVTCDNPMYNNMTQTKQNVNPNVTNLQNDTSNTEDETISEKSHFYTDDNDGNFERQQLGNSRKRKYSYNDASDAIDDTGDDSKSVKTADESKKQNHSEIEKRRRDKMNTYITELSAMVPMCHAMSRKLDKLTVLRMAVQHLKTIRGAVHSYTEGHYKPAFLTDQELKLLILQAADGFLFVVGCDRGRILYVSESVSKVLNYKQGDLLGQSWFDILHPKDVAKVKEQLSSSDLSPRERLIDAKTMLPVKTDLPQGLSRLCPGARRSFFCRMKGKTHVLKEETDSSVSQLRRKAKINVDKKYCVIQCTGYLKSWAPVKIGLEEQENEVDSDSCNLSCLVAVGRIPPNVFAQSRTPCTNPPNLRQIQFISRHAMDGKFLFVDQRATLVLGFLPQELLGTSMYEYYQNDDIPALAESHKAALQTTKKISTMVYRFRSKENGFIRLQSEWKAFRNPWTKDVEYLMAKNSVILNGSRESGTCSSESNSHMPGNFDFFQQSNGREIHRIINTHVEASKIGRQIAEEVMDYQRRISDSSNENSPDPDSRTQNISSGENSTSAMESGSERRPSFLNTTRINGTIATSNNSLSSFTSNSNNANDSEITSIITTSVHDSPNQNITSDGNDEAAMAVIMSLLEADAGLGGPVDFTGLPWPLP